MMKYYPVFCFKKGDKYCQKCSHEYETFEEALKAIRYNEESYPEYTYKIMDKNDPTKVLYMTGQARSIYPPEV